MAGGNQHHVWQMLQRGFGVKRGRDHHVWVYQKTEAPRQTATRLFGVEKHFYGPEGAMADANITKYENENQSRIQDIRKLPNGSTVDPEFAANLIAHLEIRTAFLREESTVKLQKIMGDMFNSFTAAKNLRGVLIDQLEKSEGEIDKLLAKEFVPAAQRPNYAKMFSQMIKTMPDEEIYEHFRPGLNQIERLIDIFPELSKVAHNSIFAERQVFPRADVHLNRKYSVWRLDTGSFILPDTTLAFIKKEGASPYSERTDIIEAVVLPISSDVAIVGRGKFEFDYSLKTVNRILAGCSFKAFIAKEQNTQFQGLTRRIGKYAILVSDKDLDRIIAEGEAPTKR